MTSDNVESVLDLLVTFARVIDLGSPSSSSRSGGLEPLANLTGELGAVHFTVAARDLRPVVEILRRHRSKVPPPSGTLAERILESLPWRRDGEPSVSRRD